VTLLQAGGKKNRHRNRSCGGHNGGRVASGPPPKVEKERGRASLGRKEGQNLDLPQNDLIKHDRRTIYGVELNRGKG